MRCSHAHKQISTYLDGELSRREQESLESHLEECGACRATLHELQAIHRLCVHAEKASAPSGFQRRVMAKLDADTVIRFSFKPLFSNLAEAVAALMVIGLGVASGGFLSDTMGGRKMVDSPSLLSLDVFDAAPPESLSGAYLAMMEGRHEK